MNENNSMINCVAIVIMSNLSNLELASPEAYKYNIGIQYVEVNVV